MGYQYPDLSFVRKILVVKLRSLGDVLLSTPVFSLLKEKFPQAEIDAYIYEEAYPMLEGHPSVSGFILCKKPKKFFQRIFEETKILKKIWKAQYDLVLNLTEGDRGAIACFVSRAKIKVGFDPQGKGFKGKKHLYTHKVKHCSSPRHVVERDLDSLRCIGIFPPPEKRGLTFVFSDEVKGNVHKKLKECGLKEKQFILIHPFSRWLFKCWNEQSLKELIPLLLKKGKKVVLSSSQNALEKEKIKTLLENFSPEERKNLFDFSGKCSLKEFGALLQASQAFLFVDSVSLHMASALKAKGVVLFGPTSDQNWGPWQNEHIKVLKAGLSCQPCCMDGCGGSKKSDCLEVLSPQTVLESLEKFF